MTALILPMMYPVVAFYAIKCASRVVLDVTVDKTKSAIWYMLTYPFIGKPDQCVRCKCPKCSIANHEGLDDEDGGLEILDMIDLKEKLD